MTREREFSAASERQIAVPHTRIAEIGRPIIVLGRKDGGIEWNSPDGRRTRLVFMILTPRAETQIQLQALGIIARALRDDEARGRLLSAGTKQDLWVVVEDLFASRQIEFRTADDISKDE